MAKIVYVAETVFVHIPLFPMSGNVFAVDLVVNYILMCFVRFHKKVLQKLVELKNEIIETEHKLGNTTTDSEILDVLDEPMNSLKEFQAMEERLTDVEFRRKLVSRMTEQTRTNQTKFKNINLFWIIDYHIY